LGRRFSVDPLYAAADRETIRRLCYALKLMFS
jgi:hypothetical protein